MTREEARATVRSLFLKTLPHLAVGPKMRQMVRLRDGALEIAGDPIALHEGRPVRVIALGKAAVEMTHTLAEIMPEVRLHGVVAAPSLPKYPLPGFEYFAGGHPYPNEQSWLAAEAALALLDQHNITEHDLVIFLISGGGSSLMEMPLDLVNYVRKYSPLPKIGDLRELYELLVTCGASIQEINTIRKHFSAVKGGRLARAASPARQITLYVSDVPEYQPSTVASGPTMPDGSSSENSFDILTRHVLYQKLPPSYIPYWDVDLPETPKSWNPCFAQSRYYCLLANWNAVEKLAELTEDAGIVVATDSRCDDWALDKAADYLIDRLRQSRKENPDKPVAIISGGELSCPVKGDGMGGRNQAFVLYSAMRIAGTRTVVLSAGTDGIDGNSAAAGAIADGETFMRAHALGLDPTQFQNRSDSFHFFEKLGDAIITGPTGTNVRDLRMLLAYPE
jgi:glycerate 2-kinase